jgi:hypothetical protein
MFFVLTARGMRMPIDADTARCSNNDPACDHQFVAHDEEGCTVDGCRCLVFHLEDDYNGFKHHSHFVPFSADTPWGCKDPGRFRKGRKR